MRCPRRRRRHRRGPAPAAAARNQRGALHGGGREGNGAEDQGNSEGEAAARRLPSPPVKPRVLAVAVETGKVSLAEVLEKARERRGWLRASRERTECELEERAAAPDREAAEWERRANSGGARGELRGIRQRRGMVAAVARHIGGSATARG
ncbi:hypothetical protein ACP70R_004440 [Stipagrostis hirtigluma subsp. patula]